MARRLLLCPAVWASACCVFAGCGRDQAPASGVPKAAASGRRLDPAPTAVARRPRSTSAKPPLEITPGSSTITADDAGLQLLAARKRLARPAT